MKRNTVINLLLSFGLVVIVAALGSWLVYLGMDWFNALIKPHQWLPNALIPIVWTIIYTLTGIVLFRWLESGSIPVSTRILFLGNGLLNVLWCLLFFTCHLTFVGLIAIIFNLVSGYFLLLNIKQTKPVYFYLLLIYPLWLSIATGLNLALWILN